MKSIIDNPFTQEDIATIYAKHAQKYHAYNEAFKAFSQIVALDKKVLEIGVGIGEFTTPLLRKGYDVKGIDTSLEMLKRASKEVQKISEICFLADYNTSEKFDVVFSHSGGFTFKNGKFETYIQTVDELEKSMTKVYELLADEGIFLLNKTIREPKLSLNDDAKLSVGYVEDGSHRTYINNFRQGDFEKSVQQRRLALSMDKLETLTNEYFDWNTINNHWVMGKKK